jgi:signal transduction histidine kinase
MQSNIIKFFFLSALLAMGFTLVYVSYSYHQQLKQNIKGVLQIILSDVRHQHLDENLHFEELEFFSQEAKKSSFGHLFDDLRLEVTTELPLEDSSRVGHSEKISEHEYLYLSCSHTLMDREVLLFTLRTLALFLLIFVILVGVFVFYVKRQFRWLYCLIDFCNSYKKEGNGLLRCNGTYESQTLHQAIFSLIHVKENLCHQKEALFKEAAHELKSPIAVLKARLSLFEQDEEMDKQEFVLQSQEDIARIISKLKELLFLKSIEWDMQLGLEDVNMEDNCKMMQEAFGPVLIKKSVQVESSWEESFIIHTHKDAMQKVLQAVFENIFMHTKSYSTIYVTAKPNEIFIKNEIGGKNDTLFSSYIGTKMIERLSEKLAYEYKTSSDEKYFYTRLIFHSMYDDRCTI